MLSCEIEQPHFLLRYAVLITSIDGSSLPASTANATIIAVLDIGMNTTAVSQAAAALSGINVPVGGQPVNLTTVAGSVNMTALGVVPPGAPSITSLSRDGATIAVTMQPGSDGGSPILRYTAYAIPQGPGPTLKSTSATPALVISGTAISQGYQVVAVATNAAGSSIPSPPTLAAATPSLTVLNITVLAGGFVSVNVSVPASVKLPFTVTAVGTPDGPSQPVTLTTALSVYRFRVKAQFDEGESYTLVISIVDSLGRSYTTPSDQPLRFTTPAPQ